jgi:hypothetical protein
MGTDFRDTFTDNPVFEIVQTDANGRGTLTFTLPDQITSWRVTAIGLTQNGFAGDVRENISSSLDFYVDLILTNEFIAGDDIAAVARAYGASGDVNFIFSVLQNGASVFSEAQISSSHRVVFNAGKLAVGDYVMQITAANGDLRDAVELPFTVSQSGLIIRNHATREISSDNFAAVLPENFNMRNMPVRVTLTNANIRPLTQILHGASSRNSFRTDNIAAAAFADYFFTGEHDVSHVRSQIHAVNGGIPELVYADPDIFYTARFAASFPEYVNRDAIIRYVRAELTTEETPARRAAALLAMAAIGEPVLLQIRDEAANADPTDTDTVLYLAAALVAIGDDMGAQELIARNAIRIAYNETELANTLSFFVNAAINPQAAWDYARRERANEFVSDIPERINFVRRVQFLGGTISELTYFLHGETHTVRLENFDRLSLLLSQEQFAALALTPTRGETEFHFSYYGYDSSDWNASDNRVIITRTIAPDGDLFRVTLHVTLPADARGPFTIYDRLPSNMRFIPRRTAIERGTPWFTVRHTQRQLVELTLFASPNQPLTRTLTYHAMQLFDADMAQGTTFITNRRTDNHIWGGTQ